MKFWRWCLIVGALLVGAPASAAWPPDSVRYVRADADGGNSGRGNSSDSAWTMAEANALARAGHTVVIAPGSYSTGIDPANGGDENGAHWDINLPGRITFVGKTTNAQACSLPSITIRKPRVTVRSVTVKQNGSITIGELSKFTTSTAKHDSLVGVFLRRGSGGLSCYGMQYSVIYGCTLMTAATGTQAIIIAGDGETGWASGGGEAAVDNECPVTASPSCPGDVDTAAPLNNYFRRNVVTMERIRKGDRKFLITGHALGNTIDSNYVRAYFDSAGSDVDSEESGIGIELSRAYYTVFGANKWIIEADGSHNEYWRAFAFRDSVYGTLVSIDTVYAGLNVENLPSMSTNRVEINYTIGQTGTQCCDPASTADAWNNNWLSCRFVLTGGVRPQNGLARDGSFERCVIVSIIGDAVYSGDVGFKNFQLTRNTLVSKNSRAIFVTSSSLARGITGGQIRDNIFYVDSVSANADSSSGAGGVIRMGQSNHITSGVFNRNVYYARKVAADTFPADKAVKQCCTSFYKPGNLSQSWSGSQAQDRQSKFGNPRFLGLAWDETTNLKFYASPESLSAGVGNPLWGYYGALRPVDTVAPSVPTSFAATATGASVAKTFSWYEAGDDSLFFNADSVFVCERASVDSSRIDNTNFRDYIVYGFASGTPNTLRTYNCSAVSGVEVPPSEPWSGCGSEAILPGDVIGFVRIVTKDEDGNLSFSQTLQLTWTP